MNLLKRQDMNGIEGINFNTLKAILYGDIIDGYPKVDSIILDKILLTDRKKIKCIKNYYSEIKSNNDKKLKANARTCVILHRKYNISCNPFDCIKCHRQLIDLKNNGKVIKF